MKLLAGLSASTILAVVALSLLPAARPAQASTLVNDGVWSSLDPSVAAPIARREYAAVYDDHDNRMIIFSGLGDNVEYPGTYIEFNEVWALSLGDNPQWERIVPTSAGPGERQSPQWGYDAARRRLIVFGGYGHHYPGDGTLAYLDDVWELSLIGQPHWRELFPLGTAPAGRLAGCAVYDPLRQRFIGFGGTRGLPVDTWELDLSAQPIWRTVNTDSTRPNGSYGMASIYDPVRDRMVIFGGSTSDQYFGVQNDTWELRLGDNPTWHKLAPGGTLPYARRSMSSIYDPLRDRMVIFGGWDATPLNDAFLNETWAMDMAGDDPTWGQLAPGGTVPIRRDAIGAIYDPTHDRLVVYGGWEATYMLHDTEFLSWGGSAANASLVASAQAAPQAAQVQWNVQNATGPHTAVYRRQTGTEWSSIATRITDQTGAVQFDDSAVQPGQQYGYELIVSTERGTTLGGEVWVTIPTTTEIAPGAAVAFALDRVAPNPVVDRFDVTFALPSAAAARLDLVDVAGRRVLGQEVGSLGAGSHTVQMAGARSCPPGVYFLRLTQGGRTESRRVVLRGGAD